MFCEAALRMDAGELVTASEAWTHSSYETVHEQKKNTSRLKKKNSPKLTRLF